MSLNQTNYAHDPNHPIHVILELNRALSSKTGGEFLRLEYRNNTAEEAIVWSDHVLWDNDLLKVDYVDEEETIPETIEACVRRRFDELMRLFGSLRLAEHNPALPRMQQRLEMHEGLDYVALMFPDQSTHHPSIRVFGDEEGEAEKVGAFLVDLWNSNLERQADG